LSKNQGVFMLKMFSGKNKDQKKLTDKVTKVLSEQEMKAVSGAGPVCCISENGKTICFADPVEK
tara:strand:+ start:2323 stop:2514 length:192 start_codon:yes stop_codon:yes gene_type:complete